MSYQSGSMNPNASQPATAQVETSQQHFGSPSASSSSSSSAAFTNPSPAPEKSQQPTPRCFGWKGIGNPFPVSLAKRSNRATILAADFLTNAFDQVFVSQEVLQSCRGLVFLSVVKGSYLWSGRFGSGVVVARLDNGLWSAPSAINCVGVGYGAQAGLLFTDMVIVLRDENSLGAFLHMGNVTIGASLAAAVGPWGRTGEFSLAATCATAYSLSSTSGLGGGISVEGLVFMEGRMANEKCYGRGATARSILAGHVSPTDEVFMLVSALNERFTNQRRFSASEKPPIYASPEGPVLPNYGSGDKTALIQHN